MGNLILNAVAFAYIFVILLGFSSAQKDIPPIIEERQTIVNGEQIPYNVPYYRLPYNNEPLPNTFPFLSKYNKNDREVEQPLADEPNYRLPNNTEPIHYDVELSTNVHTGDRNFSGKVTIQIHIIEDTRTIVLHARQLQDFEATIREENSTTSHNLIEDYEDEREFLSMTPESTSVNFQRGETWIVTIKYNGTLRLDNGGFYLSTYTDERDNVRNLATTQFESTDSRHAFPCYDEPAKRATFRITIKHDPSYHAISNTPIDTENSSNGVTVFQKTINMPSYLVAFIVSDFEFTKAEMNSISHRVFSRPGTENHQEWALLSGMLLLQSLSNYFGIDYALPKMDQVAVPDFAAGAMENWGLVTYREGSLLYNKKTSTVFSQTSVANIIGHEFTHQWFGNYVTPKWWCYLWLKEGFATLFSYEATNMAFPEWGVDQAFHTGTVQAALNDDAGVNPRPMTYYIQKPSDISRMYDTVSYAKAGSVLSMWQHALTDAVFRLGLRNYLEKIQLGAAEENDLFEALQTAVDDQNYKIPATVQKMISSWSRQGGYPVLNVTRNYNDESFLIQQKPFYSNASHDDEHTWYVPFNFATKSSPDFRDTRATHFLLNTKELNVNDVKVSSDDWLLLNKQSTGYYRIYYDEKNYGLLAQGLREKPYKFHPRNRAQLMHDAYIFTMTDRLKQSVLMDLLTYLTNEDQYAPWSTANGILTTLNFYLSGDSNYNDFKEFVAELVGNVYAKLGVDDVSGDQHYQKYTRTIVINLACMVGVENCLEETNSKLVDYIEKGTEVEPNVESQVYCNGLRQSSDKVFDFFYNKLMSSAAQSQRLRLISYLGCSQKESQIRKFIESSINMNNNLQTTERTTLLSSAYTRGDVGLYTSINFLKDNWEAYGKLSSNRLNTDIQGMARYVVSTDQEKALLELVDIVKDSGLVSGTLEQSVRSNIDANLDWLKLHRGPIMNWISDYQRKSGNAGSTMTYPSTIAVALLVLLTKYI